MVFWITLAMVAAWRYVKSPGYGWALLFGTAGAWTHATKETGAISFFTLSVAGGLVLWAHRRELSWSGYRWAHLGVAAGGGWLLSMALFSVGFREPQAIFDSIRTYFLYLDRAEGSGHEKPWDYYFRILAFHRRPEGGPYWTEGLTLILGLVGLVVAFTPAARRLGSAMFWRWLALYTVFTAAIYAAIPYKTPWSMLSWVFTLMLLAGLGLSFLLGCRRPWGLPAAATALLFVGGLVDLAKQTEQSLVRFRADDRNPFVYAHTPASLIDLVRKVHEMARLHPEGKALSIAVCDPDAGWPLPWYFRDFPNFGLARALPTDPEVLAAQDIIVIAPVYDEALMEITQDTHRFETVYGIRDAVKIYCYVKNDLYERFLESRGG